ncbi:MAG TPA: FtsQ-type POTRA domain-containing protein [Candidatus Binatia bacterium]|nr:FtsQ-type POTRA domain-containing protein [Candidatus Binatia bacterium]
MALAVYRRDNRKRTDRRRRRALWIPGALVVLLVLGFAVYAAGGPLKGALVSIRAFVFENPYFAVSEIQVRGGEKVRGDEIIAMAGLRQGMNIWNIEPAAIEEKVAKLPWVRRVLVRREFPRRVVIDVEERIPKAIVALGKLYYVDGDGVVFKEVGPSEKVNFPLLTGLRSEELGGSSPAVRKRIQDAVRVGELMAKDSHALSEIHFEPPDRLVVYTTAYPVAMRLGSGDWDAKLQQLGRVLALWKGHEERLASLDVSFKDQVVARFKRAKP